MASASNDAAPGSVVQGGGGNGGANGGAGAGLPNPSFDLNGNAGVPGGGDDNGQGGGGAGRPGFGGAPSIQGTVQSVTPTSVTITLTSGQTVTIGLGASTTYHQQAAGSQADVAPGKTVILKVNGRVRPDQLAGGASLGTASDVTVVP